jgi:hypothetical protein
MLPGMKHRIEIWLSNRIGQTIVRPARFGSGRAAALCQLPALYPARISDPCSRAAFVGNDF